MEIQTTHREDVYELLLVKNNAFLFVQREGYYEAFTYEGEEPKKLNSIQGVLFFYVLGEKDNLIQIVEKQEERKFILHQIDFEGKVRSEFKLHGPALALYPTEQGCFELEVNRLLFYNTDGTLLWEKSLTQAGELLGVGDAVYLFDMVEKRRWLYKILAYNSKGEPVGQGLEPLLMRMPESGYRPKMTLEAGNLILEGLFNHPDHFDYREQHDMNRYAYGILRYGTSLSLSSMFEINESISTDNQGKTLLSYLLLRGGKHHITSFDKQTGEKTMEVSKRIPTNGIPIHYYGRKHGGVIIVNTPLPIKDKNSTAYAFDSDGILEGSFDFPGMLTFLKERDNQIFIYSIVKKEDGYSHTFAIGIGFCRNWEPIQFLCFTLFSLLCSSEWTATDCHATF